MKFSIILDYVNVLRNGLFQKGKVVRIIIESRDKSVTAVLAILRSISYTWS